MRGKQHIVDRELWMLSHHFCGGEASARRLLVVAADIHMPWHGTPLVIPLLDSNSIHLQSSNIGPPREPWVAV